MLLDCFGDEPDRLRERESFLKKPMLVLQKRCVHIYIMYIFMSLYKILVRLRYYGMFTDIYSTYTLHVRSVHCNALFRVLLYHIIG